MLVCTLPHRSVSAWRERERERCAVTRQAPASPVMQGVRKIEEWIGQKGKKVELEPAEILYESSFSGNQ